MTIKHIRLAQVPLGDLMILTDWVKDQGFDAAEPPLVRLKNFPRKHARIVEQWLPYITLVVEVYIGPWAQSSGSRMWLPKKCFGRKAIWSLLNEAGVKAPSDYYENIYKYRKPNGRIERISGGPKDYGSFARG